MEEMGLDTSVDVYEDVIGYEKIGDNTSVETTGLYIVDVYVDVT